VRPGQLADRPAGLRQRQARQAGGRRGRDVGPGLESQQPEQAGRGRVQVLVRPGEHGTDRGALVPAGLQDLQPVPHVRQLAGQVGQRGATAGGGQLGGDPQRQRQPAALVGQPGRRIRVVRHPAADQAAEQVDRLGQRKRVER
jgi:hypothetical protein